MKQKIIFLALFFLAGLLPAAECQTIQRADPDREAYLAAAARAADRVLAMNAKRFSPFKSVNQSYTKTQEALQLIRQQGPQKLVEEKLKTATALYRNNFVASLFLGLLLEDKSQQEAAKAYTDFYTRSLFPAKGESDFINDQDLETLRTQIYQWFLRKELPPPQVRLPFTYKIRKSLQRLSVFPEESKLGVILAYLVMVGGAFLLFYRTIYRFEIHLFSHPIALFGVQFYWLAFFCYGLWMVHLFLGLAPFWGGSLVKETTDILLYGTCLLILNQFYQSLRQRWEIRKNPNLQECPKCHRAALKVLKECPHCRETLP